jgi:hypothetical protein
MKKNIIKVTVLTLSIFLISFNAFSNEKSEFLIEDDLLGCEVKFDERGDFKSIKCPGEAELDFFDSNEIRIAKKQAIMRAKAKMAYYFSDRINSQDVQSEIINKIVIDENEDPYKLKERISFNTEKITNQAEEILKGVTVIYTDINKDARKVIVHVGANIKTMKASDQLKALMNTNLASPSQQNNKTNESSGRVVNKSKNYDDF